MEADYIDTYTTVLRNTSRMTAKDLFRMMFVYYPKPVQYLLRFRDWLVKPFGLQGGDGFTDLIKEKDEGKVTFGKSDKHLEFQVLLQCDIPDAPTQCQSIRITTVVKYHNSLGKVYFFSSFSCFDLQMASETSGTKLGERKHSYCKMRL